jgi:hypothetical protein
MSNWNVAFKIEADAETSKRTSAIVRFNLPLGGYI